MADAEELLKPDQQIAGQAWVEGNLAAPGLTNRVANLGRQMELDYLKKIGVADDVVAGFRQANKIDESKLNSDQEKAFQQARAEIKEILPKRIAEGATKGAEPAGEKPESGVSPEAKKATDGLLGQAFSWLAGSWLGSFASAIWNFIRQWDFIDNLINSVSEKFFGKKEETPVDPNARMAAGIEKSLEGKINIAGQWLQASPEDVQGVRAAFMDAKEKNFADSSTPNATPTPATSEPAVAAAVPKPTDPQNNFPLIRLDLFNQANGTTTPPPNAPIGYGTVLRSER